MPKDKSGCRPAIRVGMQGSLCEIFRIRDLHPVLQSSEDPRWERDIIRCPFVPLLLCPVMKDKICEDLKGLPIESRCPPQEDRRDLLCKDRDLPCRDRDLPCRGKDLLCRDSVRPCRDKDLR